METNGNSGAGHRTLGRTGVQISPLVLGTAMLGSWGNADSAAGVRLIHRALDSGINAVDTADGYSNGEAEEIVGKALRGRRDQVILATKFGNRRDAAPNRGGGSRRWIIQAVEASLKRLQTDWIDLYQLHRPDPDVDLEETLEALTGLVRAGTIRYVGSSAFPAELIVEAQWTSAPRGLDRFATEQPSYSILVRDAEAGALPSALRHDVAVLAYSPLAAGWLSGRYRLGTRVDAPVRAQLAPQRFDLDLPVNRRKLELADAFARLADDAGLSLVHLAIAWVLRHPAVTAAVVGPRTEEQLDGQLGAASVTLGDDLLDRIDELVPPGTTVNPGDHSWRNPALEPEARRRRPPQ